MRTLLDYLRPYRRLLVGILVLAVINQVFSLLDPQILRIAIDKYATHFSDLTKEQYVQGIIFLMGGTIGVAMISRIAKNFQDYFINVMVQSMGTQLYADGVAKVLSLPYREFEDTQSGSILSQLQKARQDTQDLITLAINSLFISIVTLVFVVGYAFTVHWSLGVAFICIFPILGGFMALLSRRIRAVQQQIFAETTALSGATTESLRNIELVKSLGLTDQEIGRLNATNSEILRLELKKVKTVRTLSFVQGTLINLMRAILMGMMFWLIYQRVITVGQFLSLMFYMFAIVGPLNDLGTVITKYQETLASLANFRLIQTKTPEEVNRGGLTFERVTSIRFKNVTFSHPAAGRAALAKVDFEVKAGESLAFVGPSGAGKSTLVKLLLGLYRPDKGDILFNGQSGQQLDWEWWRGRVGFVPQAIELFSGTIKDNLRFVKEDATDDECWTVLRQAQLEGMLQRAPLGLETKVGEGGLKLSGGERQRLAIARALLRAPDLLIFDEATSSLDTLTEQEIATTIKEVTASRPDLITVMIAHRLSTIVHADRILVLERGKLIEQGTHHELLKEKGLYAALWREQSAG